MLAFEIYEFIDLYAFSNNASVSTMEAGESHCYYDEATNLRVSSPFWILFRVSLLFL